MIDGGSVYAECHDFQFSQKTFSGWNDTQSALHNDTKWTTAAAMTATETTTVQLNIALCADCFIYP